MKAMILAAGLGTRLKPWTDNHPKALAVVNGKSLLQRNIEYLQQYNIYDIIVNVHHFADQVKDALEKNNSWGSKISISDETETVLETGGGLKKAAWYFKDEEDFIVINVDILTDLPLDKMIAFHINSKALATLAVTGRITSRYFLFNSANELCGWENTTKGERKIVKKADQYFKKAFSGIHVINKSIFSLMQQAGKFSIVDVYLSLALKHNIMYFDHSESKFIDVGKPERLANAAELFP